MIATQTCAEMKTSVVPYTEGTLAPGERGAFENHLRACAQCRETVQHFQAVQGFLRGTVGPKMLKADFLEETGKRLRAITSDTAPVAIRELPDEAAPLPARGLFERLGAAPWWGVSVALHALVIILLGLITMTIGPVGTEDLVVVLTTLEKRPELAKLEEQQQKAAEKRDIFKAPVDVAATDPDSPNRSNIVVPPDILAQAELGDHFETINLDRPDTHSAFGNPEARMFHSVNGSDDVEGGGGNGGVAGMLDDLIGVGGSASPGTGGGWGGGNGTGIGIGNGSGTGSFGQRNGGGRKLMVMRFGGSKATESAVDKGLEWLAKHQEPDGHWDSAKYGANHKGQTCDTAATGWALLAFLGAGHSEKIGKYKDNVKKGIAWLIAKQEDNGCLSKRGAGESVGYNHSIAGMALAEAAGMGRVAETKAAAQKAIDYSVNIHQCGEGSEKRGWRYSPHGEGDLSNSGWFIMQLKSAKVAGLHVDPAGFDGATWFLNHCEDKNFAKDKDSTSPYENGRHRYGYTDNTKVAPRRTAIGCLCRQFMGTPKEELAGGVEWFVNSGRVPTKTHVDLYYWYYGTLCTFQQGEDIWKKWNEALKPALLDTQSKAGDNDGSWDPAGAYNEAWGRVGQTAISIMCLEVYYRYLPMYRE